VTGHRPLKTLSGFPHWNGTAWEPTLLRYWDGTAWSLVDLKTWTGSAWVPTG
jgi:hypothetical protein